MANKSYDILFKILLIGDSNVGKTDLLFRFSEDEDGSKNTVSAIGIDFRIKTIDLKGKKIKLQMWDTAGQERFHSITTSYYRGASGIMLVYDVTNAESFKSIPQWLKNVNEHTSENVGKMLLGNNCELEEKRQVSKEEGETFSRENGLNFMETSAKNRINVDRALDTLVEDILNKTSDSGDTVLVFSIPQETFVVKFGENK